MERVSCHDRGSKKGLNSVTNETINNQVTKWATASAKIQKTLKIP